MKTSIITLLSALAPSVIAHSWLHCTAHNNTEILEMMKTAAAEAGVVDPLMPWFAEYCHGWPRAKQNPGDWVDETKNYLWDLQAASQRGDNHACHVFQRTPLYLLNAPMENMPYHKDPAPMASAYAGESIKLMFGGNGHSRGANAGGNGDPGRVSVYWAGKPETELVTIDQLNGKTLLQENGFSDESFSFPDDPNVHSPAQGLVDKGNWQTLKLPKDMGKGRHMMVWVWSFGGLKRFSTCFDVMIK